MNNISISKRVISIFVVMTLLFALCLPAFAAESSYNPVSREVGFESLTKEEYIQLVMERTGKSRNEIINELNAAQEAILEKYGVQESSPPITQYAFDTTASEYIGNGVTMFYGYVYFIDTYANSFQIRSECPASYAQHHYGASFSSVETSGAQLHAASSGQWVLESVSCQATQSSSTTVRIQYSAVIDVVKSVDESIGADLEFFHVTGSESSDTHLRQYVSHSNSYTLPASA